jgi:hypothetical protein
MSMLGIYEPGKTGIVYGSCPSETRCNVCQNSGGFGTAALGECKECKRGIPSSSKSR